MKYFSLFSGVGGFEISLEKCGVCVGFSEIDKYAISVYQYHYPKHKNYGDITQIDWNTVPDFDLVVGGSPCQDLSVAGKQKGLSGERSGLFFEFIRCLKEKQPRNFIWENVKGALSSSSGWDFARVQIEFSEAGYDVEWQVLNAKDFGVPQNRERIFVVGHLRGKSEPKVFPINWIGVGSKNPAVCLTHRGYGSQRNGTYVAPDTKIESIGENTQPKRNKSSNINVIRRATYSNDMRIRKLTCVECERLMSWPDNWTKTGTTGEISDTQRYKMCGNGVVSKVVEAVIERLSTPASEMA